MSFYPFPIILFAFNSTPNLHSLFFLFDTATFTRWREISLYPVVDEKEVVLCFLFLIGCRMTGEYLVKEVASQSVAGSFVSPIVVDSEENEYEQLWRADKLSQLPVSRNA